DQPTGAVDQGAERAPAEARPLRHPRAYRVPRDSAARRVHTDAVRPALRPRARRDRRARGRRPASRVVTSHATPAPAAWVRRFAALAPRGARVLDLACGHGRHARLFASLGHDVLAVDVDASALAALGGVPGIETRAVDLE